MASSNGSTRFLRFQFILPAVHFALCPIMFLLSASTPGGTWYRLVPVDPICWPFLFVITGDAGLFVLFAILGTSQWFLVGRFIDSWIGRIDALD